MATPPPLNPSRLGDPIGAHASYVKRTSAEKQAEHWNRAIANDPTLGPSSGLVVGVAPLKDDEGRYPLVWVTAP